MDGFFTQQNINDLLMLLTNIKDSAQPIDKTIQEADKNAFFRTDILMSVLKDYFKQAVEDFKINKEWEKDREKEKSEDEQKEKTAEDRQKTQENFTQSAFQTVKSISENGIMGGGESKGVNQEGQNVILQQFGSQAQEFLKALLPQTQVSQVTPRKDETVGGRIKGLKEATGDLSSIGSVLSSLVKPIITLAMIPVGLLLGFGKTLDLFGNHLVSFLRRFTDKDIATIKSLGDMMKDLGIQVILVAASQLIMNFVEWESILKLSGTFIQLSAMALALAKSGSSTKVGIGMMLQISAQVLVAAGSIWIVQQIPVDQMAASVGQLGILLLSMAGTVFILGKMAGSLMSGLVILGVMTLSLLGIALSLSLVAQYPIGTIWNAVGVFIATIVAISLLCAGLTYQAPFIQLGLVVLAQMGQSLLLFQVQMVTFVDGMRGFQELDLDKIGENIGKIITKILPSMMKLALQMPIMLLSMGAATLFAQTLGVLSTAMLLTGPALIAGSTMVLIGFSLMSLQIKVLWNAVRPIIGFFFEGLVSLGKSLAEFAQNVQKIGISGLVTVAGLFGTLAIGLGQLIVPLIAFPTDDFLAITTGLVGLSMIDDSKIDRVAGSMENLIKVLNRQDGTAMLDVLQKVKKTIDGISLLKLGMLTAMSKGQDIKIKEEVSFSQQTKVEMTSEELVEAIGGVVVAINDKKLEAQPDKTLIMAIQKLTDAIGQMSAGPAAPMIVGGNGQTISPGLASGLTRPGNYNKIHGR